MVRTRAVVTVVCALSLATVGCSSSSSATGEGIGATEKDFSITVSPSSIAAGDVTFTITNEGPSTHEFLVVKSDQDPGSLTVEDGEVPEDSLDIVDEQEEIAAGTAPTLTVTLDAGSYILMCNVPDHYSAGMHAGLTVT